MRPIAILPEERDVVLRRFEKFFVKTNGCWIWKGGLIGKRGFRCGVFWLHGAMLLASRVSYALYVEDPGELNVLHTCDLGRCVNYEHLFTGTQQDNMEDMWRKGRARPDGCTFPPRGV